PSRRRQPPRDPPPAITSAGGRSRHRCGDERLREETPPLNERHPQGANHKTAPSAAGSTYREYASPAAFGRRLAYGPFSAACWYLNDGLDGWGRGVYHWPSRSLSPTRRREHGIEIGRASCRERVLTWGSEGVMYG